MIQFLKPGLPMRLINSWSCIRLRNILKRTFDKIVFTTPPMPSSNLNLKSLFSWSDQNLKNAMFMLSFLLILSSPSWIKSNISKLCILHNHISNLLWISFVLLNNPHMHTYVLINFSLARWPLLLFSNKNKKWTKSF